MSLEFLSRLEELDGRLLLAINSLHTPALDVFFSTVTARFVWLPLYGFLVFLLLKRYGRGFLWIALFAAVMITLSDQLASSVFKPMIARLRPCHDARWSGLLHLVDGQCGGRYGFVSSHASNTFALLAFLYKLMGRESKVLMYGLAVWAVVVSISRVYLGVHFPGDVLCGALLGTSVGLLMGYFCVNVLARTSALSTND